MAFTVSDSGQSTWQHRLQTGVQIAGAIKTGIDVGRALWGVARAVGMVAPLL